MGEYNYGRVFLMAEFWDILDKNRKKTGHVHKRGEPMGKGEYHLVVHVWIMNDEGEYLIAQRTPNKSFPNMWECVGGSAVAGDNSLTTALKEVREELGVVLESQNGQLFKRYQRNYEDYSFGADCGGDFVDVWLFRQNVDISAVTLNPNETIDAMWASRDKINRMIDKGIFTTWGLVNYINELF